ncbi:MAG: GFA family protein [Candidatus Binataceae bacterium]
MNGSCLCGAVEFEISGLPQRFGFDHCSRCRKSSGSAFAAWMICQPTDFRWLRGNELVKVFELPVRETPPGYRRAFCGKCGGPVPLVSDESVGVPAGTLDDDPVIRPQGHIFVDFKAPWFAITDSLPQLALNLKLPPLAGAHAPSMVNGQFNLYAGVPQMITYYPRYEIDPDKLACETGSRRARGSNGILKPASGF